MRNPPPQSSSSSTANKLSATDITITKKKKRKSSAGGTTAAAAASNSGTGTTPCCSKIGLKRGPWTPEEDDLLVAYLTKEGEGRWRTLPKRAGLLRCGKSCRLRWMNYLRPSVKRGRIADDEEDLILRLHRLLGNRWSLIAGRIPGRTDNEIKNYWNTHLSKKLISQGIDPRTHKPLLTDLINPSAIDAKASSSSNSKLLPKKNHNLLITSEEEEILHCTNNNILDSSLYDHHHQQQHTASYNNSMISLPNFGAAPGHFHRSYDSDDILNNDDVFSSFLNSLITDQEGEHQLQQQQQDQADEAMLQSTEVVDPLLMITASSFGKIN